MNAGAVGDWEINHCTWLSLHISSHAQLPKAISQIPTWSLCHPYTILCIITIIVFSLENSQQFLPVRDNCSGRCYLESLKEHMCERNTFQALQIISFSDACVEAASQLWRWCACSLSQDINLISLGEVSY